MALVVRRKEEVRMRREIARLEGRLVRPMAGRQEGARRTKRFNMEWTKGMTWKVCRQHITTSHCGQSISHDCRQEEHSFGELRIFIPKTELYEWSL